MTDEIHYQFGGEWFCADHQATFELHEAENNGGDCPWCDRPVEAP